MSFQPSKIRVQLNRPLTWAEWEHLNQWKNRPEEIDWENPEGLNLISMKLDEGKDFSLIHITAEEPSREVFDGFALFLAEEFVNVFPKSVLTKQEYKEDAVNSYESHWLEEAFAQHRRNGILSY